MKQAKIRLFVEQPLGQGQTLNLNADQAHYLFGVMRRSVDDVLLVFNGKDGEWLAKVEMAGKRKGVLVCQTQTRPQMPLADIWLLFAPIKKNRMEMLVEKAVELGVARLMPVLTEYTNSERVRMDKTHAHAKEAAEQCGATQLPLISEPQKLRPVLDAWPKDRTLVFADESLAGDQVGPMPSAPAAILIGPEGGFSPDEREMIGRIEQSVPITLGPRILRAETAAIAALTLWQAEQGDWAR